MNWYLKVLREYANFSGRARRKEYWMFILFNFLLGTGAVILDNILGIANEHLGYGALYLIYCLLTLIPGVAVAVRRLHDVGRSGWWLLIALIPLVGAIVLVVFFVIEGQPHSNNWGENPKIGEGAIV